LNGNWVLSLTNARDKIKQGADYLNIKDNSSVSLLMKDRPEIAKILDGHDSLKRWLAQQFSGKQTGFPIQ